MIDVRRFVLDVSPLRTSRDFRYLFIARVVSILGLGILAVTVPLQTFRLTGSTTHVALVATILGLATFLGTFAGGVLADRFDRRVVIALARGTVGVMFTLLAVNAMLPEPQLWVIYLCAAVDGFCGGVSATALMAVTPTLVPRDKLPAAGALMALTADVGSMVGPALGGIVIAAGNFATAYGCAAITTFVTTFCITRLPALPPTHAATDSPLRSIASGIRYAFGNTIIGGVLVAGFVTMILAGWAVLIPEYATTVLGVGSTAVGLLYAAPAVGAALGSLSSGWTSSLRRVGLAIFIAMFVSAAGLVGAGAGSVLTLALICLAAHGFGDAVADIVRYATVQKHTPDEMRGRVAGVWSAQVTAGASVGSMIAGVVAFLVPVDYALLIYGLTGLVATTILTLALPTLRRFSEPVATPDGHSYS
ncbi:enterobactin transporter EntS [Millisia brevis]|uniref:enterobactin transporter EntS n=1 Tax=Millisia brevis TaxID=264148 RepID=UPI000833BE2E|nr:enterobactin transporter EntS [Millisia brevis]